MKQSIVAKRIQAYTEPTHVVGSSSSSQSTCSNKFCPSCFRTLPTSYFGSYRSTKDGLAKYCKPCSTQKFRYPKKDPTKNGYKDSNNHPILFNVYKHNYRLLMELFNVASMPVTDILAFYPQEKKTVICRVSIEYGIYKLMISGDVGIIGDKSGYEKFVDDVLYMLNKKRIRLELDEASLIDVQDKLYFI